MVAPPPGYLEEGLLHSEAGQQNWWTSSASSSSSLKNEEGTDKQRPIISLWPHPLLAGVGSRDSMQDGNVMGFTGSGEQGKEI